MCICRSIGQWVKTWYSMLCRKKKNTVTLSQREAFGGNPKEKSWHVSARRWFGERVTWHHAISIGFLRITSLFQAKSFSLGHPDDVRSLTLISTAGIKSEVSCVSKIHQNDFPHLDDCFYYISIEIQPRALPTILLFWLGFLFPVQLQSKHLGWMGLNVSLKQLPTRNSNLLQGHFLAH